MLTLTNSGSGIKVVFHDPAFTNTPLKNSAWKKMTIYLPGEHEPTTMKIEAGSGYMVNDNADQQWSPDGKFMTVWDTYGIINKDEFSGQRILFINLDDATDAGFTSKGGYSVTTDSFHSWVKGKPHVILRRSDKPGVLEEARNSWD